MEPTIQFTQSIWLNVVETPIVWLIVSLKNSLKSFVDEEILSIIIIIIIS